MLTVRRRSSGLRVRSAAGFSIVELAVSMGIMAIVLTGIMVPMVSQIAQRNITVTEKTLGEIRDALLGFAAANGRLPCPAVTTPTGAVPNPDGSEAFDIAGGGNASNGRCLSFVGFVPGRTLGITPVDRDGYALDAWGSTANRIRYAVSSDAVTTITPNVTNPFTSVNGMRNATLGEVAKIPALLMICDSGIGVQAGVNCNAARTLTSSAVAVIWSVGANASTGGGTGADERENPNPQDETSADRIFVSRTMSGIANNPFDDIVTWLSINTLVNRMVGSGQLP